MNNEQSEVNTKIPDMICEMAAILRLHMVIKSDNDPGVKEQEPL